MNIPIPPNEYRWRCQKCGRDFEEKDWWTFCEAEGILAEMAKGAYGFAPRDVGLFIPLSGPRERAHRMRSWVGGRTGVLGSSHQVVSTCGPIRMTEIDVQELFLEFGEKRR